MNRLIIIGASGHGKVVADIAKLIGYKDIIFLDNDISIKECSGIPVLGSDTLLNELDGDLFIAVGNACVRKKYMEAYSNRNYPVLIHPNAVIPNSVSVGDGTVIMAGVIINPDTRVGRGCIINTSASIDHDCVIEDYSHVSVGAHLCGSVHVGKYNWIGAGATVINNINICSDCMVGAGAVVIHNIDRKGTYVGVPARPVN